MRNQDVSSAIYDIQTKAYFSDDIKYQIEFADVLRDNYVFYKTSPILNHNKDWAKFRCHINFPVSRKKVKYTIRRLDKENNNLFVSDISMVFTNKTSDPYKFAEGSWNCLSTVPTPWKDIWKYDGSFQVVHLSSNMSISCWVYLHYTDSSLCFFLLGSDMSNGTPGIYMDNSNIIIHNVYDDSSYNNILSTRSSIGIPTHFVLTYFNSNISTYMNGVLSQTVDVSQNTLREAYSDYNIYLGNPSETSQGVILKSVKIYDYTLDLSFISNTLYKPDTASYQIGNPSDLSSNKIVYSIDNHSNPRSVTLPVLSKPSLLKNVYLNSTLYLKTYLDLSSVSMWLDSTSILFINNSFCECTPSSFSYRGHQIKLSNSVNHFVITRDSTSSKLYMNGYLYLSDSTPITNISGTNLGEVVIWNKILSESNVLTSYYNYYNMYATYDMSGQYKIFVEYPKGISARDVSYVVYSTPSNPLTDGSGTFYLSDQFDVSNIVITLDPLTLNTFNKQHPPISVRLTDYNVVHDISVANVPYIQYNYSNIQYLTEATTVNFWLENIPSEYTSFPYAISGDVTGSDLSNSSAITGSINRSNQSRVTIMLKEDYTIENMEKLIFNVPSLNLSTLLNIYDRLYFTSTKLTADTGDVFTISLRNKMANPTARYNYQIMGVSGGDIGGVDLSGTFVFRQSDIRAEVSTVDVSLSIVDISFTVTANNTSRTNLPFKMVLTDDYSYVSVTVWVNDNFNLTTSKPDMQIKEGENFSFTLKLPYYVTNNTSYAYTITGISNEDLERSPLLDDISGYFVAQNLTATKNFKYAYNAKPDLHKTLKITVMDLSLSLPIINVVPVFSISGPTQANEGESFTITLEDMSKNLPNNTSVNFQLAYVSHVTNLTENIVPDFDVSANSNMFTFQDNYAHVQFTAIPDNITDGGKIIEIMLLDFSNVFYRVAINDTSQSPSYLLVCDKLTVYEGETFKITLVYSNVPAGLTKVPFDISGISAQDISGLSSLYDEFTIPWDISRCYTVLSDSAREGTEHAEFRLTAATNPSINVIVDISDSSQAPIYRIDLRSTDRGFINNSIKENDTFLIDLSTNNVKTGSMVGFSITGLSYGDLSVQGSDSLVYWNNSYSGVFTVGYNESFSVTSNIKLLKSTTLSLSTLPFLFNSTNTTTSTVTFTQIDFAP